LKVCVGLLGGNRCRLGNLFWWCLEVLESHLDLAKYRPQNRANLARVSSRHIAERFLQQLRYAKENRSFSRGLSACVG
jgi:hypothetical protein